MKMKKVFFAFKLYYLIYVLCAFNAFINILPFFDYATLLLTVFGLFVALCMVVRGRDYLGMPNIWIIAAFLVSYGVSSLLNYQYGIVDNGKEIIWLLLSMVVLYASGYCYTTDEMKREFAILSSVWVLYCTVANAISMSMVIWGREYGIELLDNGKAVGYKVIGFKWGRLWGIYDDPNHGATIAVAAILLALYLIVRTKTRWKKATWSLTIVIQFGYIVLSDSRTALVALGIGVFFWLSVAVYHNRKQLGDGWQKSVVRAVVLGILAAVLLVGAAYVCKQEYNVLDKKLVALLPKKIDNKKKPTQIGRKEDLEGDASNGRLDIWKSGLEITQSSPVYGVSFRNMTAYAEENMPDTYLVNNPESAKYDSLHNSIMDVLVSQGIIGIGIVLILFGNTVWIMRKKLRTVKECDRSFMSVCFAVLAAMGGGSLFLSMVFYLNAPQTYIFWLCFGYFMTILQRGDKVE